MGQLLVSKYKVKDKVSPVYFMKAYRGAEGIMLNLGARWR
jgi:hypothetical protein